jgi:hypothetical protein
VVATSRQAKALISGPEEFLHAPPKVELGSISANSFSNEANTACSIPKKTRHSLAPAVTTAGSPVVDAAG